jgi:hypothetical protein
MIYKKIYYYFFKSDDNIFDYYYLGRSQALNSMDRRNDFIGRNEFDRLSFQ